MFDKAYMSPLVSVWLIASGLCFAMLFHEGLDLPLNWGVLCLFGLAGWGILTCRVSHVSLLPRLMILLYVLPFAPTIGYLFAPYFVWIGHHDLQLQAYTRDRFLMANIVMLGIVGVLGLLVGIRVGQQIWRAKRRSLSESIPVRTLSSVSFMAFAGIAILLSYSSMSRVNSTIFSGTYTGADNISGFAYAFNLNAGFLLSYILVVLLYLDAERSKLAGRAHRWKFRVTFACTFFIVVFCQLLVGDRESFGLLVGLIALYLSELNPTDVLDRFRVHRKMLRRKIRWVILPVTIAVSCFLILGTIRNEPLQVSETSGMFFFQKLIDGAMVDNTWTAVLLNNFGLAIQYRYDEVEYLYGATYWDVLLSLPPGVLTAALGIERPLEAHQGPSHWFPGIGAGGMHPVVVPFKNFGAAGTFFVLMILGMLITYLEKKNRPGVFWARLIYGCVVTSSFLWFWYGDMNVIRALMGAVLFGGVYRVSLHIERTMFRSVSVATNSRGLET